MIRIHTVHKAFCPSPLLNGQTRVLFYTEIDIFKNVSSSTPHKKTVKLGNS